MLIWTLSMAPSVCIYIYIFICFAKKNKQTNKQTNRKNVGRDTATAVANYSGPGVVNLRNRAEEERRRQTLCDEWTIILFVTTFLPNFTFL